MRLGHGHAPSAGIKFAARVFNTKPAKIAAVAGDITALTPLMVVCATGTVVCVGFMARTLLSHPDIYLAPGGLRGDVIRDNQKHSREHHAHLIRRATTHDVTKEDGEFYMQIMPALNKAGGIGHSVRRDPEEYYRRAVAEAKRLDEISLSTKPLDVLIEEAKTEAEADKKVAAEAAAAAAAAAAATAAAAAAAPKPKKAHHAAAGHAKKKAHKKKVALAAAE